MEKLENPQNISDHLLAAHAAFDEETLSLSGKWRFWSQNGSSLPDGWTNPDFNDRKWGRIPVPGAIENAGLPGSGKLSTGLYRKSFILSKDHGSRQVVLRFEAVSALMMLWVNGIYVGKSEGNFALVEFDISSALRPDKNIICIQVTSKPREPFTGLLGDAALYSLPSRAITHIQPHTIWQEDGTPLLQLNVETRNANGFTARVALMDENRVVAYSEAPIEGDHASVSLPCPDVVLWSSEYPKLYRIAVILWDGVAMYHNRELRIGIRRLEQDGPIVLLNGKKETVFAAEYDPTEPESGTYCSPAQMEQTLVHLKKHHFNGILIQKSAPEILYRLCDRLGLYLIDRSCTDPKQHLRHFCQYSSHPCILAWNGNSEDSGILSFDHIALCSDPASEQLSRMLGQSNTSSESGVFLKRRSSRSSESPETDNPHATLLRFTRLPDGLEDRIPLIRDSDGILGIVFSADWSETPMMRELRALLQPVRFHFEDGTLSVTNLRNDSSAADAVCKIRLSRDGEDILTREFDLDIAPGETGTLLVETQYDIFKAGRYHLMAELVDRESGFLLGSDQWEVAHLRHIFDENPGGTIREDQGDILMRSRDSAFTINRAAGVLEQISLNERPVLTGATTNIYTLHPDSSSGFRKSDEWEKASTPRKRWKPSVFEVDHMTRTVSASFKLGSGLIQNCRLYSDGSMAYELRLRTGRTAPELMGVTLPLDPALTHFRWFGLGPDNVTPAHRAGRFFGLHEETADHSHSDGYKESVYHLTVTDGTGFGLMIRSEDGMRASMNGNELRLMLSAEKLKPHTTYTFGFTIQPIP